MQTTGLEHIRCECGSIDTQTITAEPQVQYSVVGFWCHDCRSGFTPTLIAKVEHAINTSETLSLDSAEDRARLFYKLKRILEEALNE